MQIKWSGTIDAAHFIPGHPKCGRLHGHTYHICVELAGGIPKEHPHYMVDYAEVKRIVNMLDHRLLIPGEHPDLTIKESRDTYLVDWGSPPHHIELPQDDILIMPITETSAECLAMYLSETIQTLTEVDEVVVIVSETPNTAARSVFGSV